MKNSVESCIIIIARTVALDYLNRGFSVIPLQNKQGVPGIGWVWAETTYATKDQINQWFTTEKYQVGIVCGKISSVVVVDVDSPEALEACITRGFPDTPKVETSRGHHYYFKWPGEYVKTLAPLTKNLPKDQQIPDLDIRGDGGCIVAPPSIHEGGHQYVWCDGYSLDDLPLAELPKWILEIANGRTAALVDDSVDQERGIIKDGERNSRFTAVAGALRRQGLEKPAIFAALKGVNQEGCALPIPDRDLQSISNSIGNKPVGVKQTQNQVLMAIGESVEFFQDEQGSPYARFVVGNHKENWGTHSSRFNEWLVSTYVSLKKTTPSINNMKEVLSYFDGKTREKSKQKMFLRIGGDPAGEHIYVDLANDDWTVIDITKEGWGVMNDCPVRFKRSPGMQPLPLPVEGGSLEDLRRFVNVTDDDWKLLLAWLVYAYHPGGPYPILLIQGQQGSAKTTTARILSKLVDPNISSPRTSPMNVDDFIVAAENQWIVSFDNLTSMQEWLANALCQISTGGGLSKRKQYTGREEEVFSVERPIILNGIDAQLERPDLLDRIVALELPQIKEQSRMTEKELTAAFEAAKPGILGAIFRVLMVGLQNKGIVVKGLLRLADFQQFVVMCEPALPWKPGEFTLLYSQNSKQEVIEALEGDLAALILRTFLEKNDHLSWTGTSTELLIELENIATDKQQKSRSWPKGPRALSAAIKRDIRSLKVIGVETDSKRTNRGTIYTFNEKKAVGSGPAIEVVAATEIVDAPKPTVNQLQFGEKTNKGRELGISLETPVDPIIWLEDNTGEEEPEKIDNDTTFFYHGMLSLREPVLGGEENDLVPFN